VHARDAVWSFELTQQAPAIAERLPGKPPLRFVPGPLPDEAPSPPPENVATAPPASPELEQEAARIAAGIEDSTLREIVARAARASLVRAAWDRRDDRAF
jgi:hypothetical protein